MISEKTIEKYIQNLEKIDSGDIQNILRNLSKERDYLFYLFDHLSQGVLVLSKNHRVDFINNTAKQILSKSLDRTPEKPLDQVIEDPALLGFIEKNLHENNRLTNSEVQILIPKETALHVCIIPLLSFEGREEEVLLLLCDVSDKKLSENDKQRAEKIEALASLTAGIAHEIGNPLNSINIHLNLLAKELEKKKIAKEEESFKTLKVIQEETQRLDNIIRNFLKATRSKTEVFKLLDPNALIEDVCRFLKPEFESKKISLVLDLDSKVQKSLFDEESIRQMLINVLKNSIEAIQDKSGEIIISTQVKSKLLFISVKDTGVGIPDSEINQIFDTYFTTKEEGSGLGLMVVYNVVRDHGGRIEVQSREGEGTEFIFILPVRQEKLKLPEGVIRK